MLRLIRRLDGDLLAFSQSKEFVRCPDATSNAFVDSTESESLRTMSDLYRPDTEAVSLS